MKRERPESSANSASRPYGSDLTAVLVSSSSPIGGNKTFAVDGERISQKEGRASGTWPRC